jgi:hypothetical protein
MRPVNRVSPKLAAHQVQSFEILSPRATHQRPATCGEVACQAHANGWVSTIDESTTLGQRQAHYIRNQSGRRFTVESDPTGVTRFKFIPGQLCFGQHYVSLDRPEFFLVRDGDWRGNPTGRRLIHDRGDQWVDDFSSHQESLIRASER